MKKIALALDFKNNSIELLETAKNLCLKFNADLDIIHIDRQQSIDIPVIFSISNPYNSEEEILQDKVNQDILNHSKKKIDEILNEIDLSGINTNQLLAIGEIDKQLIKQLNSSNPDLFIISITEELDADHFEPTALVRVLDEIKTPTLAIPSRMDAINMNRFVFAYDNDMELQNNLNITRELAASLNAEVLNLKVFVDEIEYRQYQENEGWMDSAFDYSFVCPDVYSGLVGFFNGCDASVLVINHEKRNFISEFFHDSMTKRFLINAKVPLLIFDGDFKDWNLIN